MKKIHQADIEKYIKLEIDNEKLYGSKQDEQKIKDDIERIRFMNRYEIFDIIFPFHILFRTKEPIPINNNEINYNSNYKYYMKKRYEFVNLLNKKTNRHFNDDTIQELILMEKKYFFFNCLFQVMAFSFLWYRPFKKLKILNYYFFSYFFFSSKILSMSCINKDILRIKAKIPQDISLNKRLIDVYDYTLIPDWRCYLYYYEYI
jgi:hypothetical protein